MPTYKIKSPDGRTITLRGESPPTEADLDAIFAQLPPPKKVETAQGVPVEDKPVDGEVKHTKAAMLSDEEQTNPFAINESVGESNTVEQLQQIGDKFLRGVVQGTIGVGGELERLLKASKNPVDLTLLLSGQADKIDTVLPTIAEAKPYTNAALDEVLGESDYSAITPSVAKGAEFLGEAVAPLPPIVKASKYGMELFNNVKAVKGLQAKATEADAVIPFRYGREIPQPPSKVEASWRKSATVKLRTLDYQKKQLEELKAKPVPTTKTKNARQAKKETVARNAAIDIRIAEINEQLSKAEDGVILEFNQSQLATNIGKAIDEMKASDDVAKAQDILFLNPKPDADIIEVLVANGVKREDAIKTAKQADEIGEPLTPIRKTNPEVDANQAAVEYRHVEEVKNRGSGNPVSAGDSFRQKYLLPVTNRIGRISSEYANRIRKSEFEVMDMTANDMRAASKFIGLTKGLAPAQSSKVLNAMSNSNYDEAIKLVGGADTELGKAIGDIRTQLQVKAKQATDVGVEFNEIKDYFPRLVTDFDGLYKELLARAGKEDDIGNFLEKAFTEYAKKKGLDKASLLTSAEKDMIASNLLRKNVQFFDNLGLPTNTLKQRTIQDLSEDLFVKFYEQDPEEILIKYYNKMNNEIALAKLFGKGGLDNDNLAESLGRVVNTSKLSNTDLAELADLTQRYFKGTRRSMNSKVATIRDVGTITTLANIVSAAKNLADILNGVGRNGVANTLGGMFDVLTNKQAMTLINTHLRDDAIRKLFASDSSLRKFRDGAMKWSGFEGVERLNKATFINAAWRKNRKIVSDTSSKAFKEFEKKWKPYYGDDFPKLVEDLKAGNSDSLLARFHMVNEATKIMPTSRMDIPISVADNPNAAIFYQLKSYPLRQWATFGEDVVRQWKAGNKDLAVKNALFMMGYLSASGLSFAMIGDLMLGRDIDANNIPTTTLINLAGSFGMSKYDFDNISKQGNPAEVAVSYITPAGLDIVDLTFGLATDPLFKDDPDYQKLARKVVSRTPVFGKLTSNWALGGREEANKRLRKERLKAKYD